LKANNHPGSSGPYWWWETSGSLAARLLRLDGRLGAVVNVEKQVAVPVVVSDDLARHLGLLAQQMGLGTGDGSADHSDRALVFEPIKPSFTREVGSSRRPGPTA